MTNLKPSRNLQKFRKLHEQLWARPRKLQTFTPQGQSTAFPYLPTDLFPPDRVLEPFLFVRKEYKLAQKWILEGTKDPRYRGRFPGAVITGHSGVGTSTVLE
ncbi:hypothetical protein JAAARDRAFT_432593 [Jaapia argillacea MUCL 33604]|uniref:Uncharacterized protein n=1 Tax=Jaapia argillacea MUCL 33604 TaxID=933084 RepID=A0A067PHI7_9AGAM|nr:hypothetical protein JAAARDRAFT_432593 [Jaapia argillacea MUCL 33604]